MKEVVFSCLIVLMVSVGLGPAHEDHTRSKNELLDDMERVRIKKEETRRSQRRAVGCEYEDIVLECPHYQQIAVQRAIFGNKQWECAFYRRGIPGCTTHAEDVVKTQCDRQHRCRFKVEEKFFKHYPCFTLHMKRESLQVWYTCLDNRGDGTITRFACEHSRMVMDCPSGQDMRIVSAVWGRQTKDKCNPRLMNNNVTRCDPDCRLDRLWGLQQYCSRKKSCETWATHEFLGGKDSCVGNSKYWEVKYRCQ